MKTLAAGLIAATMLTGPAMAQLNLMDSGVTAVVVSGDWRHVDSRETPSFVGDETRANTRHGRTPIFAPKDHCNVR